MKRLFAVIVLMAMLLAGCTKQATQPKAARTSADYYTVYSGEITTLNYLVTASTSEQAVAANAIDTLVEYDNLGILKPALAEKWEVSPDGLTYTFHLRKGVKWVTWEGKEYAEVTAQDFVDALKYIFDPKNASKTANVAYSVIKNGEAYYKGEITDFSQVGVKALDKYTLQYTLEKPVPYFLTMLTYVCFMPVNGKFLQEVGDKFGTDNKTILYNGAYIMSVFEPQNRRVMVKNEKYWDAGNVFIKKLEFKYNKEASTLAPELFLRGEISGTGIPTASLDGWMNDPAKKKIVIPAPTNFYTYFYAFNFDPHFDEQYEPENWKIAVNNVNFRKAIFHALDRKAAMMTAEPYNPERRLSNTITPKNFVAYGGKDYTQIGELAQISARDSFNKELALQYRDKAKQELAGKAKFPVKVMMPYNTASTDWTNRVQVIEQQLEGLLGKDFIDIIPVGFPPTNFLTATRRSGNYALQECNWGPDYADPETYTDPFYPGGTYNWPEKAIGYTEANGKTKYQNLVDAAKAEVIDIGKRYELFAKAEAFLINEAFVIPYAVGGGGYMATKLEPFTSPYAPFGVSELRFKGQVVFDKPIDIDTYNSLYEKWQKDRAAALEAAGKSSK
ncbi:MAG TPA: peptide ABC transporter substrate-binding protein [Firmicutes bacterium]|nr:peptide ABC transporter substrate-binding protein [Candidatus Fermentithermobacillaceae bacterium]